MTRLADGMNRISRWCWLFVHLGVTQGVSAQIMDFSFMEPFSGSKVDHYELSLPGSSGKPERFVIPMDCERYLAEFKAGSSGWGGRMKRLMAYKVAADCRLFMKMATPRSEIKQDFVSDYDFMSASLDDLPFGLHCVSGHKEMAREDCYPNNTDGGVRSFLDLDQTDLPAHEQTDLSDCRLEKGAYRGRIVVVEGVLKCVRDRRAPGFRFLAVDYSDVNNDGVLDAVLRVMPIGRGRFLHPQVVCLTRMEEDGSFINLDDLDFINRLRTGQ